MEQEPIWTLGDLAWAYRVRAENALAQNNRLAYLIYDQLNKVFYNIVAEKSLSREQVLQRFLQKLEAGKWPVAAQAREQAAPIFQEAITDIKNLLELFSSERSSTEGGKAPEVLSVHGGPVGMVYALTNLGFSEEEQKLAAKSAAQELEIRPDDMEEFISEWLYGYNLVNNTKRPPGYERD